MSQQQISKAGFEGAAKANTVKVPSYAWVILVVAYIASVAAPLNQFKVPPVMPVLIEAFNLSLSSAGLLMSVFAITGLILALPTGIILQRLGLKVTGLIAMGGLILGSILGALSSSAGLMLISRVIEGVGMGLIIVVAPASIAMWFPPEKQGTPMGIWATCVPLGSVLMFLLAPAMASSLGWQSIWWFGAAFAILAFVLVWLFMRMPPPQTQPVSKTGEQIPEAAPSLGKALSNRGIWLLGLMFACFNMVFISLNTFYPTFLSSVRNYSIAEASTTTSLVMIAVIIAAPLAGILLDKIGSRKLGFTLAACFGGDNDALPVRIDRKFDTRVVVLNRHHRRSYPDSNFLCRPRDHGQAATGGDWHGSPYGWPKSWNGCWSSNFWHIGGEFWLGCRRILVDPRCNIRSIGGLVGENTLIQNT